VGLTGSKQGRIQSNLPTNKAAASIHTLCPHTTLSPEWRYLRKYAISKSQYRVLIQADYQKYFKDSVTGMLLACIQSAFAFGNIQRVESRSRAMAMEVL